MGIVVDAKAKFEAAAAVVVIGAGGAGAMAALAARNLVAWARGEPLPSAVA